MRGIPTIISTNHPRGPTFALGSPPRVVKYEVWGPVLQAPAWERPNIVGCLKPPLLQVLIPPSTHGRNSGPSLTIIPISLLLCARPHDYSTGNTADSTPPPVPSSIIPSRFIRLVRRDSIVFDILVVVALKISTLCTSYQQLYPHNQKIGFVSCFTFPI